MARIIYRVGGPFVGTRATCPDCGAVFEIDATDKVTAGPLDSRGDAEYYTITCPNCGYHEVKF